VADKSDTEVAALLRKMEVDIAVDLMGFTENVRSGIFAGRPAPIQVNFLGFPGTMGAPYMDYVLVDPIVVPATEQPHYAEKLVHMPDSYMPCDFARAIAPIPSRAEAGLPENGFVFCSFNNVAKINPEVFDVWMSCRAIEGSGIVAVVAGGREVVQANLTREAGLRGRCGVIAAGSLRKRPDHRAHLPRRSVSSTIAQCSCRWRGRWAGVQS
jgi:predicted O-linked N-acetylglucosamine transferase (SPINDLY family)